MGKDSLTGLGERSHLTGPHVDLSLHVRDVVNTVRYEDLHDIVLLGFSYGGMVVTGALEQSRPGARLPRRVRPRRRRRFPVVSLTAGALGGGDDGIGAPWSVPALPRGFNDPAVGAWSNPRRHAQPLRTLTEPVRVGVPVEQRALGRTYIRATADPDGALFDASAARARTSPAWRYHELATGHMVPENRPAELTELLLTLA